MFRYLVYAIFPILLVSCDDDPISQEPSTNTEQVSNINIVTGLNLTDLISQSLGSVGTANNYGEAIAFPNPATTRITIQLPDSTNKIISFAIVEAKQDTSFSESEINAFFVTFQGYEVDTIALAALQNNFLLEPATALTLDFSNFPKGYYRLICTAQDASQHAVGIYVNPESQYPAIIDELLMQW